MTALLSWLRMFLALGLLIFLFGFVGNFDYADQVRIEAEEKVARPERVREYYRELLCDCLKLHEGRWLRLQIVNQPDRELCRATCIYEGGAITKGTL